MEAMGTKILFMFALTPHVKDEDYQVPQCHIDCMVPLTLLCLWQAAIKSFETNNGIPCEVASIPHCLHMTALLCQVWKKLPWKPDYQEGSEVPHHHCTITAPSLHHHCTITAPGMFSTVCMLRTTDQSSRNLGAITAPSHHAPSLHHHCTITAPSLHHRCTITAPSLHHHLIFK